MRLRILGSAAGGGLPQWNCACANCAEARRPASTIAPRTQDALALGSAAGGWFLVNASPDIHRQLEASPALHPQSPRVSPFEAIVLTNGDLDHVLGLFSLRESTALVVYATRAVQRSLLEGNTIARTLQRFDGHLTFRTLTLEEPVELRGPSGAPSGLRLTPVALPGKVPKHLEGLSEPSPEDNIGLWIDELTSGKRLVIAASAGAGGPFVERMHGADLVLFDGTFWSSDELIRLGLGAARAEDMAHLPIGGQGGSLELLRGVRAGRKVFTHINNTNPILRPGSDERRAVTERGWEVAEDGQEITIA
ncbi:MAG: pyrroloquinoline quinone biosynthesis protein PqqB [Byssovorax sp.]